MLGHWRCYLYLDYVVGVKMEIDIIFKIATIGILTAVISQVLSHQGKSDIATLATLAGLVICLIMVLNMVGNLFDTLKTMFDLY